MLMMIMMIVDMVVIWLKDTCSIAGHRICVHSKDHHTETVLSTEKNHLRPSRGKVMSSSSNHTHRMEFLILMHSELGDALTSVEHRCTVRRVPMVASLGR